MARPHGKLQNAETKKKISLAQLGKRNSFYGHTHTPRMKEELSDANRGKKNPMFGRKHSKATIERIRQLALKRFRAKKS